MRIPITRPWFDAAEEQAVIDTLRSRFVSQGAKVQAFEQQIAGYTGAKFAAAVSSGTAALHLALLAAGVGPGDEVLVPAFTWLSTANAVEFTGATPVFCDIDPATYNMDVADARKRLTARTKVVIAVHLFGLSADLSELQDICGNSDLILIEDAACALGTYFQQKHVGSFGQIGCFSFHPRKSITTGEGGMLITSESNYHEKILQLRNIGSNGSFPVPDFPVLGLNYRMNDLQGALGIAQFQKLDRVLLGRKEIAKRYDELLARLGLAEWLQRPYEPQDCVHSYQSYVCCLRLNNTEAGVRNDLIMMMANEGIEIRQGTHAPYLLQYYRKKYGIEPSEYPNALRADRLTIALPMYAELEPQEQELVCLQLRTCLQKHIRS